MEIYTGTRYTCIKPPISLSFCLCMVIEHTLVLNLHVVNLGTWLVKDIITVDDIVYLRSLVTSHEGTIIIVCDDSAAANP